ncbi:hypothetical protein [Cedecea sp. MMO-103]|uniref:hypothetical protein n=1 Tax=Cedecea sp. MMO-103 TaxID=3081238 RepID=UPI003015FF54
MLKENDLVNVDDLTSWAKKHDCKVMENNGDTYIGNPPTATKYPHFHIFSNGKTNLSVGSSKNETVGTNQTIAPEKLRQACERFSQWPIVAPLKLAIEWVLNPERNN